jgi:hypothetical protein
LRTGSHGVNDHRVVGVDAKYADLKQIAVMSGTDTHRKVVIESPLGNSVTGGMEHVLVSDAVLPGWLRDAHR